jgi:bifunctional DNA-binding transcriptional regulator/antitoxin component of YhaV-PrlF toxin-antitoxin module
MTATLTIDSTGGVLLPKVFLDKFALKPGARLQADVSDEGLALRPEVGDGADTLKVIEKNGLFIISGTEPFDAVESIMAARRDRASALFL